MFDDFQLLGKKIVRTTSNWSAEVPAHWLDEESAYGGDYLNGSSFAKNVTGFQVSENVWGFHLSSYGIQESGSAGFAAGRDVVILWDDQVKAWTGGPLFEGTTKFRGPRFIGCWPARMLHLFIADINDDERMELGAMWESIECRESNDESEDEGLVDERYRVEPLKWYSVTRQGEWFPETSLNGLCPNATMIKLPLLGITKDPIKFVLEMRGENAELIERVFPKCVSNAMKGDYAAKDVRP